MKRLNLQYASFLVLYLLSFTSGSLSGQCDSDIILSSQTQVDSFNINYGCVNVGGNLIISGTDIFNLDSLYKVDTIMGDLEVSSCPLLKSLRGLEKLSRIENDVNLTSNDSLTDVSMLDSSLSIFGSINFTDNPLLNSCNAYWICSFIYCRDDWELENNGAGCISSVEGVVTCSCVLGNSLSLSIEIIDQQEIDILPATYDYCPFELKDLSIEGDSISSLDSLYFLTGVTDQFTIGNCGLLSSFSGLENFQFCFEMAIEENPELEDISAMPDDVHIVSYLEILNNTALEVCDLAWVCNAIDCTVDGYNIEDNKGNCADEGTLVPLCPCATDVEFVDYILTSQGEVDSFSIKLNLCPAQIRELTIDGSGITNLDSLYGLTIVSGGLSIEDCSRLKDLNGLQNLTSVGGNVSVSFNDSLTSLEGLNQLMEIENRFTIQGNGLLTSLHEIDSALEVHGNLRIVDNPQLKMCSEYWICRNAALRSNVEINNNHPDCINKSNNLIGCICVYMPIDLDIILTSQSQIDSFPLLFNQCDFSVSNLRIEGNDISNLDSLYLLDSLADLNVANCSDLIDISGLSNLEHVQQEITIFNNGRLKDISSLNPNITLNRFRLVLNDSLTICDVPWICKQIERSVGFFLSSNGANCNSQFDLALSCACSGDIETIDVFLDSQTDVDQLGNTLNQCDIKLKNVNFQYENVDLITNLDSLIYLDSILGNLYMSGLRTEDSLFDGSGLQNLVFIQNDLSLSFLKFSDLQMFQSVQYIGNELQISNNKYQTLEGLDTLIQINGDVAIAGNQHLTDCRPAWLCHYLTSSNGKYYSMFNSSACGDIYQLLDDCSCPPGLSVPLDVTLQKQSHVNEFPSNYLTCPFPIGDLVIGEPSLGDDDDDDDDSDPILYLDSLSIVDSVNYNLEIKGVKWLESLQGLHHINYVGNSIIIIHNPLLESLQGLQGISKIPGDLILRRNSELFDLTAFGDVEYVGGTLFLDDNDNLKSLDGLESLKWVGEDFKIEDNHRLVDYSSLHSLEWIGEEFNFRYQINATNLDGLENLTYIGDKIDFQGNSFLSNISALSNIEFVGKEVQLFYNPKLAVCQLSWLCDYLSEGRPRDIFGNSYGCSSSLQVMQKCDCPFDLVLPSADGLYRAQNEISTSGVQPMMHYGVYDAPNVLLEPGFEVPKGTSLWVLSKGCE